nr:MAG TPA: hypothetical protein [Caudoviricetes sp.]
MDRITLASILTECGKDIAVISNFIFSCIYIYDGINNSLNSFIIF